MTTKEILNTHSVETLRKEISKANIKGYSKMKKKELIELMLKTPQRFSHIKPKEKKPRAKPAPKPASRPQSAYERQLRSLIPGIVINGDRDLPDTDSLKDMNKLKKKFEKELKDESLDFYQKRELNRKLKNTEKRIIIIKNTFPKFIPDENSLKDMKKWLKIFKWKLENADKYDYNKKETKDTIKNIEERIEELKPKKPNKK